MDREELKTKLNNKAKVEFELDKRPEPIATFCLDGLPKLKVFQCGLDHFSIMLDGYSMEDASLILHKDEIPDIAACFDEVYKQRERNLFDILRRKPK